MNSNIKISYYKPEHMPAHFRTQVIDFMRCIWPHGFMGADQFRDWIHPESDHPVHFIMHSGDTLIGHASVLWKMLQVGTETLKVYGLSGVLVYPNFQKQGFGKKLVQEATTHILMQDGDLGLFGCDESIQNTYLSAGWEKFSLSLTTGSPATLCDEAIMGKYLSEKGKKALQILGDQHLHFGDYGW